MAMIKEDGQIVEINGISILSDHPEYKEFIQRRIDRMIEMGLPEILIEREKLKLTFTPETEYQFKYEERRYQEEWKKEYIKNNPMKQEIVEEIYRRFELVKANTMDCGHSNFGYSGSFSEFCMGLCLIGDPSLPEDATEPRYDWQDEKFIQPCMTSEEFQSPVYDDLLDALHAELINSSEVQD